MKYSDLDALKKSANEKKKVSSLFSGFAVVALRTTLLLGPLLFVLKKYSELMFSFNNFTFQSH